MLLTQTGKTWEGEDFEGRNQNLSFECVMVEVSIRSQVLNWLYESVTVTNLEVISIHPLGGYLKPSQVLILRRKRDSSSWPGEQN